MSEESQNNPLTEEEIRRLQPSAAVALAARCAMRVQPLVGANSFDYSDYRLIKAGIKTFEIAITASAVSTAFPSAADANICYNAVKDLTRFAPESVEAHAAMDAAYATAEAALSNIDHPQQPDAVYYDTTKACNLAAEGAAHRSAYANAFAVDSSRADHAYLIRNGSSDLGRKNLFKRPLWQQTPESWLPRWRKTAIQNWRESLFSLGGLHYANDIIKRHERLLSGKGIDWGGAKRRIKNWIAPNKKVKPGATQSEQKPEDNNKRIPVKISIAQPAPILTAGGHIAADATDAEEQLKQQPESKIKFDNKVSGKVEKDVDPEGTLIDSVPSHTDEPSKIDQLGRRAFAEALSERIRNVFKSDYDGSYLINLHGAWGSGKSTILYFIENDLSDGEFIRPISARDQEDGRWIVVSYNAWEHQNSGPPWWRLIDSIYRQSTNQLGNAFNYGALGLICKENWRRLGKRLQIAGISIILALLIYVTFILFVPETTLSNAFKTISTILGAVVAIGTISLGLSRTLFSGRAAVARTFTEVSKNPTKEITCHFEKLVADIELPIIIMIDDLDRCEGDYVIELLEDIQTKFRHSKVTYVVAADRRWLCQSYQEHYKTYSDPLNEPGRPLGYLFLEKIFQLSATVPRMSSHIRSTYWHKLINVDPEMETTSEEDIDYEEAFADATEELESVGNEAEVLNILGEIKGHGIRVKAMQHAAVVKLAKQEMEERTTHALIPFSPLLEGNPRSMKRLVNAYGMQRAVAILAGEDIPMHLLALWTILSLRWPLLAELLRKMPELVEEMNNSKLPETINTELKLLFTNSEVINVVNGNAEGVNTELTEETIKLCIGLQSTEDSISGFA